MGSSHQPDFRATLRAVAFIVNGMLGLLVGSILLLLLGLKGYRGQFAEAAALVFNVGPLFLAPTTVLLVLHKRIGRPGVRALAYLGASYLVLYPTFEPAATKGWLISLVGVLDLVTLLFAAGEAYARESK